MEWEHHCTGPKPVPFQGLRFQTDDRRIWQNPVKASKYLLQAMVSQNSLGRHQFLRKSEKADFESRYRPKN